MDPNRFDSLTRYLTDTHSRRSALGGLLAGAFGLFGARSQEARAHNPQTACKKKSGDAKKKCIKKAKAHNAQHAADLVVPPPPPPPPGPPCTPNCAGRNCGPDGCSGSCGSSNLWRQWHGGGVRKWGLHSGLRRQSPLR